MTGTSKTITGLTLLALLGWGAFWAASKRSLPIPAERVKIVYQDRVVVKTRAETKQVTKTETRPDGTKIVTETKTSAKTASKESAKSSESTTFQPKLSSYSLGLGVRLDPLKPLQRDYTIELGKRLWKTPLWGKVGLSTDKTITLGIAIEF